MRHITLAVQAAVISTVLSVATAATAATVDSLNQDPFFTGSADPAQASDILDSTTASVVVMTPAAEVFESAPAKADPYANGIALQRAHIFPVVAKNGLGPFGVHATAVERSYMSAAAASASVTPAVTAAIGITVPLPASGLMLCLGLFGLARYARRSA